MIWATQATHFACETICNDKLQSQQAIRMDADLIVDIEFISKNRITFLLFALVLF